MSLSSALSQTISSFAYISNQLSVSSDNISNANTPGYTRKTYEANYQNNDGLTTATSGTIVGEVNQYLTQSLNVESSQTQRDQVVSSYLSNYSDSYGSTDASAQTISSSLDTLSSSLQTLSSNGTGSAADSSVVSNALTFANLLNTQSISVQRLRQQADGDIASSVTAINTSLDALSSLNTQISKAESIGASTADLIDKRSNELGNLSKQIGNSYYLDTSGNLHVYTTGGQELLGGNGPNKLTYTPAPAVSTNTIFAPISVNGHDIGPSVTTGKLGGLLQLRDTTLVAEESRLDNLAATTASTLNAVINQGAPLPPRNSLTSANTVSAADSFSATGSVRIAVTDNSGAVQSYADIDLSVDATVGDVINSINTAPGLNVTASINSLGQLQLTSNNINDGVSINELNSSVGSGSQGFSNYFGLNNLFDGNTASTLKVSNYLASSNSSLAIGKLSSTTPLAVGSVAIASGDTSVTDALVSTLGTNQTFVAAGGLGIQSSTLSNYAGTIISSAAAQAKSASDAANTSQASYTNLSTTLSNETGVNVDNETINSTILQNAYDANASLLKTIQSLFTSLLQAVQ